MKRVRLFHSFLFLGLAAVGMSCDSDSTLNKVSSAVTSLTGGTARVLSSVSTGAPHIVTSGPITASYRNRGIDPVQKILEAMFPRAFASPVGLSTIWDPTPGSPLVGARFSVLNTYMGGAPATCNGATPSMCTDGTVTFPQRIPVIAWIGQAMDPNFKNSNGGYVTAFGRLREALRITCAIGFLITDHDTDGLPTVGAHSITFPAAGSTLYQDFSASGCGLNASDVAGLSTTATVTATGGSVFTKKISINVGSQNDIYLKLDLVNGILNFMDLEDTAVASSRNKITRSIVKMTGMNTPATTKIMYEFASQGFNGARNGSTSCFASGMWNCDFEFYRAIIDNANDIAYLLVNNGNPGDDAGGTGAPTMFKQFLAAARPVEMSGCTTSGCSEAIALSIAVAGQRNADGNPATNPSDYNGCVNVVSRAITTDNSLACGLTGTTIGLGSGVSATVIEASRIFYGATTSSVPNIIALTNGNTDLSFTTGANIYTAPTAQ